MQTMLSQTQWSLGNCTSRRSRYIYVHLTHNSQRGAFFHDVISFYLMCASYNEEQYVLILDNCINTRVQLIFKI